MTGLSEARMLLKLQHAVKAAGGVRAYARLTGLEASDVSRSMNYKMSGPVAESLGMEKVTVYVKKGAGGGR